jgi:NAD(P)-dependent dehydrogenase (short-subunit alcohol dehydrogenase family)
MPERGAEGQELAGRVAVVTGGSRGIGAGVVHALAGLGADVVVASRDVERCRAVAAEVEAAHGVRALAHGYNASDWDQSDALHAATLAELGRLDVLVNNAGMSPVYDELTDVTAALFDKVIGVNLRGPFRLTALAGATMRDAGGGTVVNVGSVAALHPTPEALAYGAAKAGLHALTQGFARAYGPSVRVNTVHPGPILTDIAEHWPDGVREEHERSITLRRCGRLEEVVEAVVFLATDRSSYVTGTALEVAGGYR